MCTHGCSQCCSDAAEDPEWKKTTELTFTSSARPAPTVTQQVTDAMWADKLAVELTELKARLVASEQKQASLNVQLESALLAAREATDAKQQLDAALHDATSTVAMLRGSNAQLARDVVARESDMAKLQVQLREAAIVQQAAAAEDRTLLEHTHADALAELLTRHDALETALQNRTAALVRAEQHCAELDARNEFLSAQAVALGTARVDDAAAHQRERDELRAQVQALQGQLASTATHVVTVPAVAGLTAADFVFDIAVKVRVVPS